MYVHVAHRRWEISAPRPAAEHCNLTHKRVTRAVDRGLNMLQDNIIRNKATYFTGNPPYSILPYCCPSSPADLYRRRSRNWASSSPTRGRLYPKPARGFVCWTPETIRNRTSCLHFVYTGLMAAETTTVRVRRPDSERLQSLAKARQTAVVDVVHAAIDALERQEFLRGLNGDYQRLRNNPELWEQYVAERHKWDALA
jgi:hypothetical protein